MELKPGTRIRSAVCTGEFVVVRAPSGDVDLRCGGQALLSASSEAATTEASTPRSDGGSQLGKRYVDEAGTLEILCTRAGRSILSKGDESLSIKGAKPLPSSD